MNDRNKCLSTDEWKKMRYTYTMENIVDSAIKKNEILQFVTTWVDLEGIMLSEISQPEKDKYCLILDVESKKQTNKPTQAHKENRVVVARDGRWRVGKMGEEVKRYKSPVIK